MAKVRMQLLANLSHHSREQLVDAAKIETTTTTASLIGQMGKKEFAVQCFFPLYKIASVSIPFSIVSRRAVALPAVCHRA